MTAQTSTEIIAARFVNSMVVRHMYRSKVGQPLTQPEFETALTEELDALLRKSWMIINRDKIQPLEAKVTKYNSAVNRAISALEPGDDDAVIEALAILREAVY